MKPFASLSLDLDNLWSYQMTHGDDGLGRLRLLPRRRRARRCSSSSPPATQRITFFVVGQDAALERNQEAHPCRSPTTATRSATTASATSRGSTATRSTRSTTSSAGPRRRIVAVTGQRPIGLPRARATASPPTSCAVLVDRGLPLRLLHAADGRSGRSPAVLLPLRRAHRRAASRAELPLRQRARGPAPAASRTSGRSGSDRLLEMPVTTMPLARVPIHLSYVLYLAGYVAGLARRTSPTRCGCAGSGGVEPSILLHPLDFLGADDVGELGFFPGMGMAGAAQASRRRRLRRRAATPVPTWSRWASTPRPIPGAGNLRTVRPSLRATPVLERASMSHDLTSPPTSAHPLVSVVIPAYNEALKLDGVADRDLRLPAGLTDRYRFELSSSTTAPPTSTGAIADALRRRARRRAGPPPRGELPARTGAAVRLRQSRGDYVVVFDSDLSYSVDHIGRMLETIGREHARIVVASPYMKGGQTSAIPWRREVMSKGVNRLLAATSH